MNERRLDSELLQRFTREGEQSAFADVVRRHLDLVFATALRKTGDHGAAQEIAQNVFAALARKAWQFAPDDSLPAWLHKTALFQSNTWLRGELGRRRREQTAAELGTTMNTPEHQPAFQALVPVLDEALLSLREKDRTALLLRFYENQSLRDVGATLGVAEDAARKRVQGALEKLTEFVKRRGFKTASVAVATAALEQTATTTSAAVASAVVSAALKAAPPALGGLGLLLARLACLTKMQKTVLCGALAVALLFWLWRDRGTAGQERNVQTVATRLSSGTKDATNQQTNLQVVRTEAARPAQSNAAPKEVAARAPTNNPGLNPPASQPLPPAHRLLEAASEASWSPDSKKLAFTRFGDRVEYTDASTGNKIPGRTRRSDGISVLDLASGRVTDLTPEGIDPAWSPDGKFISYVVQTYYGEAAQYFTNWVWVVSAQGGQPVRIRPGRFPGWTPDSKHVLFSNDKFDNGRIFSVAIDDPQEEPRVFFPKALGFMTISPDGSRIAFGGPGILGIFHTKTEQLVVSVIHEEVYLYSGWSPDGRQLACGGPGGWPGLWILDVERGGAYLVATNATMPAWSPDGKRLVYNVREALKDDVREETPVLWVMETASLPRNPVLTHQLPANVRTTQDTPRIATELQRGRARVLSSQVPASVVSNQIPASAVK